MYVLHVCALVSNTDSSQLVLALLAGKCLQIQNQKIRIISWNRVI